MLLLPQKAPVTVKLVLQGAVAPIPSDGRLSTTPPPVKSSLRTTFVSVIVPQLLTMPLKVMLAGLLLQRNSKLVLQFLVTLIQGAKTFEQIALHWLVTFEPKSSVPLTKIVSVVGAQGFDGT